MEGLGTGLHYAFAVPNHRGDTAAPSLEAASTTDEHSGLVIAFQHAQTRARHMQSKLEAYDAHIHSGVRTALQQLHAARRQFVSAESQRNRNERDAAIEQTTNTIATPAPAVVVSTPTPAVVALTGAVPGTAAGAVDSSFGSFENVTSALLQPNRSQSPLTVTTAPAATTAPASDTPTHALHVAIVTAGAAATTTTTTTTTTTSTGTGTTSGSPLDALLGASNLTLVAAATTTTERNPAAAAAPATTDGATPALPRLAVADGATEVAPPIPVSVPVSVPAPNPIPAAAPAATTTADAHAVSLSGLEREYANAQLRFDAIARLATPLILLAHNIDPKHVARARLNAQTGANPRTNTAVDVKHAMPTTAATAGNDDSADTEYYNRLASFDVEKLIQHLIDVRSAAAGGGSAARKRHPMAGPTTGGVSESGSMAEFSDTESFTESHPAAGGGTEFDDRTSGEADVVPYEAVMEGCIALQTALIDAQHRIAALEQQIRTLTAHPPASVSAAAAAAGGSGFAFVSSAPAASMTEAAILTEQLEVAHTRTAAIRRQHSAAVSKLRIAIDRTHKLHSLNRSLEDQLLRAHERERMSQQQIVFYHSVFAQCVAATPNAAAGAAAAAAGAGGSSLAPNSPLTGFGLPSVPSVSSVCGLTNSASSPGLFGLPLGFTPRQHPMAAAGAGGGSAGGGGGGGVPSRSGTPPAGSSGSNNSGSPPSPLSSPRVLSLLIQLLVIGGVVLSANWRRLVKWVAPRLQWATTTPTL